MSPNLRIPKTENHYKITHHKSPCLGKHLCLNVIRKCQYSIVKHHWKIVNESWLLGAELLIKTRESPKPENRQKITDHKTPWLVWNRCLTVIQTCQYSSVKYHRNVSNETWTLEAGVLTQTWALQKTGNQHKITHHKSPCLAQNPCLTVTQKCQYSIVKHHWKIINESWRLGANLLTQTRESQKPENRHKITDHKSPCLAENRCVTVIQTCQYSIAKHHRNVSNETWTLEADVFTQTWESQKLKIIIKSFTINPHVWPKICV